MNTSYAPTKTQEEALGQPCARWFASFAESAPIDLRGFDCRLVAGEGRSRKLYLGNEIGGAWPAFAEGSGCGVIFDGALYNRENLKDELGDFAAAAAGNDAEIILAGYRQWGEDLLNRLRGTFALVIWDSLREVFLCLRDPLGCYPLFYADGRDGLLVSMSTDVLLQQPGVSRSVNRASMGGYLMERYPTLEETFFEAVSRVPPGHVLRVAREGRRSYRYWDPQPEAEVNWLKADEVERFDELLDQAVKRSLSFGPAGIFLSGGLDSVSIAAIASEISQTAGRPKPWALSLAFPTPDTNEELIQRGAAAELELRHLVKPFFEATGGKGLIVPALEMSSSLAAPLINTWLPAYSELARAGKRRGCQTIITGNGGDEWLTVSPYLAADMLRELNFVGVYRLWQSMRQSYSRSSVALLRTTLWRFGLQPLVVPPAHRFVKTVAPGALRLRRRLSREFPKWIVPDAALRREIDQRRAEYHAKKQAMSGSFYVRDMRPNLDHPIVSWETEEMFEVYRRAGVRVLQPFWDADLIELLYRTPPMLLLRNGRNKGLIRASLARRFPKLGFDRQKKIEAGDFYKSLISREIGPPWKKLEDARILADLGILDEKRFRPALKQILTQRPGIEVNQIWSVLNLETWARTHVA